MNKWMRNLRPFRVIPRPFGAVLIEPSDKRTSSRELAKQLDQMLNNEPKPRGPSACEGVTEDRYWKDKELPERRS